MFIYVRAHLIVYEPYSPDPTTNTQTTNPEFWQNVWRKKRIVIKQTRLVKLIWMGQKNL